MEWLKFLKQLLSEKWLEGTIGLVLAVGGWYFGKWRARRQWAQKEFIHRLNISLNILKPGEPLRIRTLSEKQVGEVFLNDVMTDAVVSAARETTPQNPILQFPKDDHWHYLNAVLNEISEQFAHGQIQRDMGLPVNAKKYLICLTCENSGEMRTRKVRAMMIGRDTLTSLPATPPPFEHPTHITRWETIQAMAKEYQSNPHKFLEIELCV